MQCRLRLQTRAKKEKNIFGKRIAFWCCKWHYHFNILLNKALYLDRILCVELCLEFCAFSSSCFSFVYSSSSLVNLTPRLAALYHYVVVGHLHCDAFIFFCFVFAVGIHLPAQAVWVWANVKSKFNNSNKMREFCKQNRRPPLEASWALYYIRRGDAF